MTAIGTTDEVISQAEREMQVRFPEGLKAVWRKSNGLELPGGWRLFPVFDPNEPRKTCSHIGYENTKGRRSYMEASLISIAGGDAGNQLVLRRQGDAVGDTIYIWDHETNKARAWGKGFDYLLGKAESRIAKIEKMIARSIKKSGVGRRLP
jgi:hypothetical protein